jgi:hypothetical protein
MKITALIVVLLAGLALAAPPSQLGHLNQELIPVGVSLEDVICSQPFVFANLVNGVGFSQPNSWMIADDFTYAVDGYIDNIEIWAIYASASCTGFNIQLRSDSGSGPGAIVQSTTSGTPYHENTGLSQWGYAIWYTEVAPTDNITFTGGTKYWFAMQTTGGAGAHYWLCTSQTWADQTYFSQDNGGSWITSQAAWGEAYEQFMILSGAETSLTRDSWGAIKSLF